MISFSTGKLRKKMFGRIINLFSYSTAQTEKKLWKKIVEQMVKISDEFVISPGLATDQKWHYFLTRIGLNVEAKIQILNGFYH